MTYHEVNFDGIIGPTHNYAGLAAGNLASKKNAKHISHPKKAALEGLEKMRRLLKLGYKQGFFPPQQRPRLDILRNLGFSGDNKKVIEKAARDEPDMLPFVYSASSMWAANAATVTPSPDSGDGRVHFTPANLLTTAHRAMEHSETFVSLNTAFSNKEKFAVHPALFQHSRYADEGAANHTRLCRSYSDPGVGLFVYGRDEKDSQTRRFPARQTIAASNAIARQHGIFEQALFLQQHPNAIDAGAFHNDVVAVGNGPVLFFHQDAFEPQSRERAFAAVSSRMAFMPIEVSRKHVPMDEAIASYLFNSQLLAAPNGNMSTMRLICPMECKESDKVRHYLSRLTEDHAQPIRDVTFVDVRESMSNGGGPACLRLRVVLNDDEIDAVNSEFLLDDNKIDRLRSWVEKTYRDEITPEDLADPTLLDDSYRALDELTKILGLGNYYEFQK